MARLAVEEAIRKDMETSLRTTTMTWEHPIQAVDVTVDGQYPDSALVVTFRCPSRGRGLFGYRRLLWSEDDPATCDAARTVTGMYLEIMEWMDADDMPRPIPTSDDELVWLPVDD